MLSFTERNESIYNFSKWRTAAEEKKTPWGEEIDEVRAIPANQPAIITAGGWANGESPSSTIWRIQWAGAIPPHVTMLPTEANPDGELERYGFTPSAFLAIHVEKQDSRGRHSTLYICG